MVKITPEGLDLLCDKCATSVTSYDYPLAVTYHQLYSNAAEAGFMLKGALVKCSYCV